MFQRMVLLSLLEYILFFAETRYNRWSKYLPNGLASDPLASCPAPLIALASFFLVWHPTRATVYQTRSAPSCF
jgi:hypothetical protein